MVAMVQASLIGWAVGGAFINIAFWDMPYFVYALVMVAKYVVQQRIGVAATAAAAASPPRSVRRPLEREPRTAPAEPAFGAKRNLR